MSHPTDRTAAVAECQNCGTTRGCLNTIWTDDGERLQFCEDCAEAQRKNEALAEQLAAIPGCCIARSRIADSSASVRQLVNRLQHHDMTCEACRPIRRPVLAASGCSAREAAAFAAFTAPRQEVA